MDNNDNPAAGVKAEAAAQRALKDDYRKVFFGDNEGRRVLKDLLQYTGVLRPIFDIDNEKQNAYNAGQQSVGLLLIDVLDKQGYDAIIELEQLGAELTKLGEEHS